MALKSLLTPGSAFRVQPRIDPALWSWMWQFAKRCRHEPMIQAAHAIQAMLTSAMREYEQLVHEDQIECEWQKKGLLFAYLHQSAFEEYAKTDRLLSEVFNEPARRLSAEEAVQLEPSLKPNIAGGWLYEHDAHLRPDRLIASMRAQMEAAGGQFVEGQELVGFAGTQRRMDRVRLTKDEIQAEIAVVATGAWAPFLNEQLGIRLPIQPGKGYSITMPRPLNCPQVPMIFPEHRVVATPMNTGYRLGSIMEFAGYDESIRPERLDLLRHGVEHYLTEPYSEPIIETWYGWRPMTYDSVPIIDQAPNWQNVWMAAGHNMLGLSMAPATGRLISELVSEQTTHIDPEPYLLSRFG